MSQAYIILIASALALAVYAACAMKNLRTLRADDLLTFALWCAAAVTGIFAFLGAFKLSKQRGEETNGVYVGIFGLCLVWLSVDKALGLIRQMFRKPVRAPAATVIQQR